MGLTNLKPCDLLLLSLPLLFPCSNSSPILNLSFSSLEIYPGPAEASLCYTHPQARFHIFFGVWAKEIGVLSPEMSLRLLKVAGRGEKISCIFGIRDNQIIVQLAVI